MNNEKSITNNSSANFTPTLGNYNNLQPFRYWCYKVLPLVYDDSLSYYELLCKVVEYLNETMEDVETLHGDVTNIHSAYVELQNYVNNYFNSLDVQEEINIKLDNMASSGELYEIIRRYTDPIVNEQNDKINVLKTRMDTFSSLPSGSTSGDAELTDIRVGYDGKVYPSAGDAVREQVSGLRSDLVYLENDVDNLNLNVNNLNLNVNGGTITGKNKFNPNKIQKYVLLNDDGTTSTSPNEHTLSDKIYVFDSKHIVVSYLSSSGSQGVLPTTEVKIGFYRNDNSCITVTKNGDTDIPHNTNYVKVWFTATYRNALARCMVEFSNEMTEYEAYKETIKIGLIDKVNELENNTNSFIAGIFNGKYKKIKLIGDSITQGVGSSDFNPLHSLYSNYYTDVETEKANGTWSWEKENVNTYYGDGKVILVSTSNGNTRYYRENSGVKCWGNKFKNYFETKYNVTVNNWGTRGLSAGQMFTISGVCKDGVTRNMAEQIIEDDDDVIICMFGTNDRGDSIVTFKEELQAIVDYVKGKNKKLILMSSIPARIEAETETLKMEDVASIICDVAKSNNIEFVSLYKSMSEYLRFSNKTINDVTEDILHPNDLGHDLMYRFVLENLNFGSPIN